MRIFVVVLVLLGLLFSVSFYVGNRTERGDPNTVFAWLSQRNSVQEIGERFAPRLDPGTLQDDHLHERVLTLSGGGTLLLVVPASSDVKYRRIEFTNVTQPVVVTYIDHMKDDNGADTTQTWQWPMSESNVKLSASEQGGLLTVLCKAALPQSCALTFR